MNIDALIQGSIVGKPQQRTGKSGRPFTTCKVRANATGFQDQLWIRELTDT